MSLLCHGTGPNICYHRCRARPRAATAAAAAHSPPPRHMGHVLSHGSNLDSVAWLHDQLQFLGACYMFTGATSALIQGAAVPPQHSPQLQLSVQWDFMTQLHTLLAQQQQQHPALHGATGAARERGGQQTQQPAVASQHPMQLPTPITRKTGGQQFTAHVFGQQVVVSCELNTVIQMNPNRVAVQYNGKQLWCESLLAVRSSRGAEPQLVQCVNERLQQIQDELTEANGRVWSQSDTADAWLNKVGSPVAAAAWITQDPWLRLGPHLAKHLPQQLEGVRLINLMGSHGTKAVAAALLGAHVTCVDLSAANIQYGLEVAAAAGAHVDFVVSDVLRLQAGHHGCYDVVLLELGVLHYFIDLQPLMAKIYNLLAPEGQLVLREFHPVSTKLVTSKSKKHKVTGDYFSQALVQSNVAYSKYNTTGGTPRNTDPLGNQQPPAAAPAETKQSGQVQLRQWGLGEVVSSAAAAGLVVLRLEEEPGVKLADAGLPKMFTLVAKRPCD